MIKRGGGRGLRPPTLRLSNFAGALPRRLHKTALSGASEQFPTDDNAPYVRGILRRAGFHLPEGYQVNYSRVRSVRRRAPGCVER